ncbi:MAG: DUF1648 domain-containing protein [Halodesulfurarchaeum sp.]
MRRDRRIDAFAVGLVAAVTAVGVLCWPALPESVAIHWSGGSPDTFVSRPLATLGLFGFAVGTIAFVRLAPDSLSNTPGGENPTVLFLGVVFAWVEAIVLLWNLGFDFSIELAVLPVLVLAGLLLAYAAWRSGRLG